VRGAIFTLAAAAAVRGVHWRAGELRYAVAVAVHGVHWWWAGAHERSVAERESTVLMAEERTHGTAESTARQAAELQRRAQDLAREDAKIAER
jgi:hypothetical protein